MHGEEREKKCVKCEINKIIGYIATVTVHIYTINVTHVYTVLERSMWKIFWAKCVKFVTFCILRSFASTDVDALN